MNNMAIVNILTAISGVLVALGFKLSLSPETLTHLAGAIAAAIAVVNHFVHASRDKADKPHAEAKTHAKHKVSGFASLRLLFILVLGVLLAGCAGAPPISAEGLAAVTKDNNASVGCATGTGPWGRAGVVYVNAQHATIISGKVTVNTDCSVTMEANQPAAVK